MEAVIAQSQNVQNQFIFWALYGKHFGKQQL
jgi:hypothetical protein